MTRTRLAALGLSLLVMGCNPVADEGARNYRLLWSQPDGSLQFQTISIDEDFNRTELRGPSAKIELDARKDGSQIVAETPVGRWTQSAGVWYPSDLVTLQSATVYAHLYRLRKLAQSFGLKPMPGAEFKVGLMTRFTFGSRDFSLVGYLINNALYDSNLDRMFFVPFIANPDLTAIAFNGGVVAHEYFHRLFAYNLDLDRASIWNLNGANSLEGHLSLSSQLSAHNCNHGLYGHSELVSQQSDALKKVQSRSSLYSQQQAEFDVFVTRLRLEIFLKAINEGLADYFASVYSQDPDFVKRSIPIRMLGISRSVGVAPEKFRTKDVIDFQIESISQRLYTPGIFADREKMVRALESPILGLYFYAMGSEYARVMHVMTLGVTEVLGSKNQAEGLVLRAVFTALPRLTAVFEKIRRDGTDSRDVIMPFVTEVMTQALNATSETTDDGRVNRSRVSKVSQVKNPNAQKSFRDLCQKLNDFELTTEKWAICE